MEVTITSDWNELSAYSLAWKGLADAALEPNPFYEDWMLLPALRHLGAGKELHCLLVFQTDPRQPTRPPLLCGLFPIERQRHYVGLPVSAWSMWKYAHCFLTTPLIRKDCAAECLAALFAWMSSDEGDCNLMEWRCLSGDGPFHQLLVNHLSQCGIVPLLSELFTRAFLRPMETADRYLSTALSGKSRSALRRKAALLSELGQVEYRLIEPDVDIRPWIDSFLRIEAGGWKGQEGSALACRESHQDFFVDIVTQAFQRKRLLMSALLLNGTPIAQNCYFRAGRGSFFFKPAFDEQYARFSPGVYMECENIRYLHSQSDIDWMDACTSPANDMYNRLFLERRTIQSLLIPVGGAGRFVISVIPLLKFLKHSILTFRQAGTEVNASNSKATPFRGRPEHSPVPALR
jgi:hypothetical protein